MSATTALDGTVPDLESRIRELLRNDEYLSNFLDPEDKDYIAKLIATELS